MRLFEFNKSGERGLYTHLLGIAGVDPRHKGARMDEAIEIFRGLESGDQLGGPLGIAALSGGVAKAGAEGGADLGAKILGGFIGLLSLAAVISVGLGFMNLLPVPVLDGGHLLFYAYEAAARRPVAAKVQAVGFRVGRAVLLGLMLFATWNDLQQMRVFKILGGVFS